MKKFMAAVFALVLTLGMGVTAMADSVTKTVNVKTDTTVSIASVTDKDGAAVTGTTIEDLPSSSVVNYATSVATTRGTNMDLLAVKNVTVDPGTNYPVTITFNVSGVKAGETIYVLHLSGTRGWETLSSTVGDGTVTATFDDLSPVAFLRPAVASEPVYSPEWYEQQKAIYGGNNTPAETPAAPAAPAAVSPKTAEDNGMAGIVCMAAVCAAAVVFTSRKKHA